MPHVVEAVRIALAITSIATAAHVQVREELYQYTYGVKCLFDLENSLFFFLLLNAEVSEGIIRESRNGSHYYMQVRTPERKHSDKRKGKINSIPAHSRCQVNGLPWGREWIPALFNYSQYRGVCH